MGSPAILLVHPRPSVRRLLGLALSAEGYAVAAVPGSAEALAAMESQPFDLLFSAVELADTPGTELGARFRLHANGHLRPVILTSAYDPPGRETCDDFVREPLDISETVARVRRCLETAALGELRKEEP